MKLYSKLEKNAESLLIFIKIFFEKISLHIMIYMHHAQIIIKIRIFELKEFVLK